MSRKGENIYRRKDGRWEGRYIKARALDGKAKYGYVYDKTYHGVKAKMNKAVCGRTVRETNSNIYQFAHYADRWMDLSAGRLKESTQVKYESLLRLYILPYWGEKHVDEISQNEFEQYCILLSTSGGESQSGLSIKTISDIASVMKNILRYAHQADACAVNEIRFRARRSGTHSMRVFTRLEQEKLCNYLLSDPNSSNIGILICLFCGLRVGEICALKWDDICLNERIICVHQTMQRIHTNDSANSRTKILISSAKSACSVRKIPIPDELVSILLSSGHSRQGFFLTGSDTRFIEPRTMQNRFKAVLKKVDIPETNFHTLRHTFATRCVEMGFDVKSLSELLGHASVSITMNRYVHPSMELKRANMNRLSSLISVK